MNVTRLQSLCSYSIKRLCRFQLCKLQIYHLSSSSKSSKSPQLQKPGQPHETSYASLFNEITEILGADNVSADETPYGFSIFNETQLESADTSASSTQGVCKNVDEENLSASQDTQAGNLGGIDVGPIVHEVTQIIRAGNDVFPMEERLANLGFRFEPEVVEKVLKRCFKEPHLALRFFNWVKLREGFYHTTETYNTMLSIAGEAKELELMEELEREMEINSCEKNIKTWTILVSQYGKEKLIGKALMVFEKMRKCGCELDSTAYKVIVRSLCNAGKCDIALEFYKEMAQKEMVLDLGLYKMIMNCAAKLGDVNAVRSIADDMIRISQITESDAYGCVLKSFCISMKIREALEFVQNLKSKEVPVNRDYFETLVKGLCVAGRMSDALEIVDIMMRRNLVDGKIYGTIISGYLRKNDLCKALLQFEKMNESGYVPTASTYTELMQHLFKFNEYEKGCELYNEMLKRRIKPDSVAITAMVAGHVRQNHLSEAWKVFKNMENGGIRPTWKCYSVFIKELCRVSRTDEIFKVLDSMKSSKIVIGDKIFRWVISCMKKMGDVESVEKVQQMRSICNHRPQESEAASNDASRGQEPHVEVNPSDREQEIMGSCSAEPLPKPYNEQNLHDICMILSSSTEWYLIQEVLEKCTGRFTPELVLVILQKSEMHGSAALHFFSWVGKQAGYRHSTAAYNMAIKIAGRGKDFKHMRNLFYEMRRNGHLISPDTWTIMMMQYGRTGLTEMAMRAFEDMKANGCIPTANTYKYLIISLSGKKGRKIDDAVKLFHDMINAGHIPDKELVETYLDCLCKVSLLEEAKSCVLSLHQVGYTTPLSYSIYIRALFRAGKLEEALALVDEVKEDRSKLDQFVHGSLIHGLLKRGQIEEALAKVETMKQAGINPTVHVYTSLMVHFFREKQIGRALEIFQKMRHESCPPTVVTHTALIQGFVNIGKVAEAWDVFYAMKIKGPFPDFRTYSTFIACLCKVGKSEEALQLLSEMTESGIVPSNINFRTIFFGLNRDGKQDLALSVLRKKSALISSRKYLT